jgi:hypothetical protein
MKLEDLRPFGERREVSAGEILAFAGRIGRRQMGSEGEQCQNRKQVRKLHTFLLFVFH